MITKTIFRNEIKHLLLNSMLEGRIEANERLSLPELADSMDTSVTPVREALTQLTETGIVEYKPNRGFFVAALADNEAIEIYDLIRLMECEGLRNCTYSSEDLTQLRSINQQFSEASDNLTRIQLDALFHQTLLKGFSNQTALKIIEDLRIRISIHELKFMDLLPSKTSCQMHENLINYLQNEKNLAATKELYNNWETSIQFIKDAQK